MLKVSFKEDFKKVQVFNDKATVVTLTGKIKLPDWFYYIPRDIVDWVLHHPTVDFDGIYGIDEGIIIVSGKSVCAEDDTFDAKLGERIAESRAKIRLYKFMYTFIKKLMYYYFGLLYGVSEDTGELHTTLISDYHSGLQDACEKYVVLWSKESLHLDKLLE